MGSIFNSFNDDSFRGLFFYDTAISVCCLCVLVFLFSRRILILINGLGKRNFGRVGFAWLQIEFILAAVLLNSFSAQHI